jgi:hypothetical protein
MRKIARVHRRYGEYVVVRVLDPKYTGKFLFIKVTAKKCRKFIADYRRNWIFSPTKPVKLNAKDALAAMSRATA